MKVLLLVIAMMTGDITVITEGETYNIHEDYESFWVGEEEFLTKIEALDYIIETHDDDMGLCGEGVRLIADNISITHHIFCD